MPPRRTRAHEPLLADLGQTEDWIPDLFAALWSLMIAHTRQIIIIASQFNHRPLIASLESILRLESKRGEVPPSVVRFLTEGATIKGIGGVPSTWLARVLSVSLAIDRALSSYHPAFRFEISKVDRGPGLRSIGRHYDRTGRFSRRSFPMVLPRAPLQSRRQHPHRRMGDRLDSQFRFLVTIYGLPEDEPYQLEFLRIPARHDFAPRILSRGEVRLAFVPLVEATDDLDVRLVKHSDKHWVRVVPTTDRESTLAQRAQRAIRFLNDAGVHIALFPEFAVSPVISAAISSELRAIAADPRADCTLQLVCAGSGLTAHNQRSVMPLNECHVFGAGGVRLWTQHKLNHNSIADGKARQFGIRDVTPGEERYREFFLGGQTVRVVDGFLGRMMVLICEDLHQPQPGHHVVDRVQPEWIFVPVLDDPLQPGRWHHREAMRLGGFYDTRTIVANSLHLARQLNVVGPIGVGLCVQPGRPPRTAISTIDSAADASGSSHPLLATMDWSDAGFIPQSRASVSPA